MKRNIIIAKNAISSDLCNKIIEVAKPGFTSALTDGGQNKPTVRKSETSFLVGSIKYLDIYIPILQLINKVNNDFYNFDLLEPEHFQITKYDEKNQGFYKPHEDGVYDNVSSNALVRKLSVSIQLTSPDYYEGGTFEFPDDKEKFITEDSLGQGTAIFFPSYIRHGVVPVTKGTRYSLVCWVNGHGFK